MTTTMNDSIYQVWQIHRPVNGCTLNPHEYVLDDEGRPAEFPSRAAALDFAYEHGLEISEDSGQQVSAFAEIECCACSERYWEQEGTTQETCPNCGNADKTKTIILIPKHQLEHEGDGLYVDRPL